MKTIVWFTRILQSLEIIVDWHENIKFNKVEIDIYEWVFLFGGLFLFAFRISMDTDNNPTAFIHLRFPVWFLQYHRNSDQGTILAENNCIMSGTDSISLLRNFYWKYLQIHLDSLDVQ